MPIAVAHCPRASQARQAINVSWLPETDNAAAVLQDSTRRACRGVGAGGLACVRQPDRGKARKRQRRAHVTAGELAELLRNCHWLPGAHEAPSTARTRCTKFCGRCSRSVNDVVPHILTCMLKLPLDHGVLLSASFADHFADKFAKNCEKPIPTLKSHLSTSLLSRAHPKPKHARVHSTPLCALLPLSTPASNQAPQTQHHRPLLP